FLAGDGTQGLRPGLSCAAPSGLYTTRHSTLTTHRVLLMSQHSVLTTHHSTLTTSNVHDHLREPAVRNLLDAQPVIGDRLHLMTQRMPLGVIGFAPGGRLQPVVADPDLETAEQSPLGVEAVEQLPQPIKEQIGTIRAGDTDAER